MNPLETKLDELARLYARRSVKMAGVLREASTVIEIYAMPTAANGVMGKLATDRLQEVMNRINGLLDEIHAEDSAAISKATLRDMPDRPKVRA